ncbi:MAG TPA: cysteine hydrolase [Ideonella sp.]|nr:cysteine hydrolase [Ideonella sp.]
MTTHLFIIDGQNDFCDLPAAWRPTRPGSSEREAPALPVPGGHADMLRLARFIAGHAARLDGITATLDSHASVAVERTSFWRAGDGAAVAPFTVIAAADVRAGRFTPRDRSLATGVAQMLDALAARGKPGLVVWPVHCVTGTWGHNLHPALAEQLAGWEMQHQRAVRKLLKGEYPLSEHYGVFEAEVPVPGVAATQYNQALARDVTEGIDLLLVAGEAASHCVAASVEQLLAFDGPRPRTVLLSDCMSPVAGFEALAEAFYARAAAQGVERLTTTQAAALLT